jgi:putative membrane protein
MAIVKVLHVLCVFIWIGNLLNLSRLMGYHVKEAPEVQVRMARLYQRLYYFIGMPTMTLSLVFGMILISRVNLEYKPAWFHMKLTFVAIILLCDVACGRFVARLNRETDSGRGASYKALHGVLGLMLIGILVSVYVVRDPMGEIAHKARPITHELKSGKSLEKMATTAKMIPF